MTGSDMAEKDDYYLLPIALDYLCQLYCVLLPFSLTESCNGRVAEAIGFKTQVVCRIFQKNLSLSSEWVPKPLQRG